MNRDSAISGLEEIASKLTEAIRCAICLSDLREPKRTLHCDHFFCKSCINNVLSVKTWPRHKCPLCNTALTNKRALVPSVKFGQIVKRARLVISKLDEDIMAAKRTRSQASVYDYDVDSEKAPPPAMPTSSKSTGRAMKMNTRRISAASSTASSLTGIRSNPQRSSSPIGNGQRSIGHSPPEEDISGFASSYKSIPLSVRETISDFDIPEEYKQRRLRMESSVSHIDVTSTEKYPIPPWYKPLGKIDVSDFELPQEYKDKFWKRKEAAVLLQPKSPPKRQSEPGFLRNFKIPKRSQRLSSASQPNRNHGGNEPATDVDEGNDFRQGRQFGENSTTERHLQAIPVVTDATTTENSDPVLTTDETSISSESSYPSFGLSSTVEEIIHHLDRTGTNGQDQADNQQLLEPHQVPLQAADATIVVSAVENQEHHPIASISKPNSVSGGYWAPPRKYTPPPSSLDATPAPEETSETNILDSVESIPSIDCPFTQPMPRPSGIVFIIAPDSEMLVAPNVNTGVPLVEAENPDVTTVPDSEAVQSTTTETVMGNLSEEFIIHNVEDYQMMANAILAMINRGCVLKVQVIRQIDSDDNFRYGANHGTPVVVADDPDVTQNMAPMEPNQFGEMNENPDPDFIAVKEDEEARQAAEGILLLTNGGDDIIRSPRGLMYASTQRGTFLDESGDTDTEIGGRGNADAFGQLPATIDLSASSTGVFIAMGEQATVEQAYRDEQGGRSRQQMEKTMEFTQHNGGSQSRICAINSEDSVIICSGPMVDSKNDIIVDDPEMLEADAAVDPNNTDTEVLVDEPSQEHAQDNGMANLLSDANCPLPVDSSFTVHEYPPQSQPALSQIAFAKVKDYSYTSSEKDRVVFCVSGFVPNQAIIRRFVHMFGAEFVDKFSPDVTHVVLKTVKLDNRYVCNRCTESYLYGMVTRKWLVSADWLEESVRLERMLDAANFEIQGDDMNGVHGGPAMARLSTEPLFKNTVFYFRGPFKHFTQENYEFMAQHIGVEIVHDTEELMVTDPEKQCLILAELHEDGQRRRDLEILCETFGAPVVSVNWMIAIITEWKVVPYEMWTLVQVNHQSTTENSDSAIATNIYID